MSSGQFKEGEIIGRVLLVSRGDATEMFDPVEETLDAIALPIERGAEASLPFPVGFRWDVGRGPGFFNAPAQPIGVISLVGKQDGVLAQAGEQTCKKQMSASHSQSPCTNNIAHFPSEKFARKCARRRQNALHNHPNNITHIPI